MTEVDQGQDFNPSLLLLRYLYFSLPISIFPDLALNVIKCHLEKSVIYPVAQDSNIFNALALQTC